MRLARTWFPILVSWLAAWGAQQSPGHNSPVMESRALEVY
jgi:hypothetical protein